MEYRNVLAISTRQEFRDWLMLHHATETECYVVCRRGRPTDNEQLWYLDAVEEALCFGWIDSTIRKIDGVSMQRFSPRKKGSNWTELNKERCRRLETLGLMTDAGRAVLPPMGTGSFRFDPEVVAELKKARVWSKFRKLHPLYQRIRASNLAFYKNHYPEPYRRALNHLIEETKKGNMFGDWNDYGRLLDARDENSD